MRSEEVSGVLDAVFSISEPAQEVLEVLSDRVSRIYPTEVRGWVDTSPLWDLAGRNSWRARSPFSRLGATQLLLWEAPTHMKSEVLTLFIRSSGNGRFPFWLRDLAECECNLWEVLLGPAPMISEAYAAVITKMLDEVSVMPLDEHGRILVGVNRV